jgi:glycine betaine/choline ABC-type transport system substrate-binding protein
MSHKTGVAATLALLVSVSASSACHRAQPSITVGSKSTTSQLIVSEIVAQHLEHRLGVKIDRRPNLGGTALAYQSLLNGEIGLYPEYSGTIVTEILREQASADAGLVFERARGEMRRIAQSELLNPLGFDDSFVAVIRTDDPRAAKVSTLSEAAKSEEGWKLGASLDFQQRGDGLPALLQYKLPMKAAPRTLEDSLIFQALQQNTVNMIVAHATDGALTSRDWKMLADDRGAFVPQQACILVRQDLLMKQPGLQAALAELSGKITTEQMRDLDARVDLAHEQARDVAADFLKKAGLQ